jgi:hypothetical protein
MKEIMHAQHQSVTVAGISNTKHWRAASSKNPKIGQRIEKEN